MRQRLSESFEKKIIIYIKYFSKNIDKEEKDVYNLITQTIGGE